MLVVYPMGNQSRTTLFSHQWQPPLQTKLIVAQKAPIFLSYFLQNHYRSRISANPNQSMMCSVKTSKSGSNWLDRLWSNKGFNNNDDDDPSVPNPSSSPITDASNSVINSNSESTHSESDQNKVTTITTREISSSDNKDLFFLMNNVLSDLFNMGGCSDPIEGTSRHSRKKERIPRKQTKPKFCFVSGNNSSNDSLDCVRKDENVLAATGSLNSDKNSNNVDCGVDDDDDEEEEEEDVEEEKGKGFGVSGDKELKGYSRSEVTVIDTTCLVWKFDKLVFRKKNVWKVRDKKGKSWVSGSKKRKVIDLESANGNGAKKKAKVSNLEVGSSKDANDVQKPEDERREEVEMAEDHSQVATKRIHLSRSPDKSKKSGSSVIFIKAIPTSNKSGRNITKNRLKDTQK